MSLKRRFADVAMLDRWKEGTEERDDGGPGK